MCTENLNPNVVVMKPCSCRKLNPDVLVVQSAHNWHRHADGIAAMDLFVVPTMSFQLLYGLLILKHGRRTSRSWAETCAMPSHHGIRPNDGKRFAGLRKQLVDPAQNHPVDG